MFQRISFLLGAALFASTAAFSQTDPVVIENQNLSVTWDASNSTFSLTAKSAGGPRFVQAGRFAAPGGSAEVLPVADSIFGRGQTIRITHEDGSENTIQLFPALPFALFHSSLRNSGSEALVTNHVPVLSLPLMWDDAKDLRTLGTGGLLPAEKNPGSYVWQAVANPESRHGVVAGWITENRGSGIVFTPIEQDQVRLEARLDYGRLQLLPGRSTQLETFAVGYFDDARLGLEAWAGAVAQVCQVKLRPQPTGYCTWYSRPHGGASDEEHLTELARFAAKELAPFGFSVVQIDDHWQAGVSTNGPKRNFTRSAPDGPYPHGMKAMADKLRELGMVPGLWFMPFAGTYYDPFFQDHQDWFVKRTDGQPYETAWGGTCLDMTDPGARGYLRQNINRIAHDWGYQYFKMDGLWTGTATKQVYVNSGYKDDDMGDARFHNPEKTNIEAYRDGLKLVRDAAGSKVFFLGCCSPQNMRSYGGAFGLVDAMRIGPDNGSSWNRLLRGPTFGSRQYFLHGRVWYNDPDPVYVRAEMPLKHAELVCSWAGLTGQLTLNSDWLPGLPAERLNLLKRIMPSHGLLPRPVDLFEESIPRIWLLTDTRRTPRRDVIGLFNWSDHEANFDTSLKHIGLPEDEYMGFDFWGNKPVPNLRGNLALEVPGQSCRIISVRPVSDHPQLISTSRHVSQGIIDVREEHWADATRTLAGQSLIVGHDPYELRVALPKDGWKVEKAALSPADLGAGATVSFTQEPGLMRARIVSPQSRRIGWKIRFSDAQ